MSTQQRKDKYFGAHEFQAREEVVKTSSDRGFGLMFGVVFGLIAGYGAYRGSTLWPYWLGVCADGGGLYLQVKAKGSSVINKSSRVMAPARARRARSSSIFTFSWRRACPRT
jgi:hypothetical protein